MQMLCEANFLILPLHEFLTNVFLMNKGATASFKKSSALLKWAL